MAKFKDEYTQRFSKLKEALKKYNGNPHMNEGNSGIDGENVVANRYASCVSSLFSTESIV
jgi:hypothetical protein